METPQNNTNRNIIIVVAVLAIVACCCLALIASAFAIGRIGTSVVQTASDFGNEVATQTVSERFSVQEPVQLTVDVPVGSIDVSVGAGDTVDVQAVIKVYASSQERAQEYLERMRFDASQSGSEVRVIASWTQPPSGWRGRSPEVELRIAVPANTTSRISLDVGEITVAGTQGDLDIKADVGKVVVRDVQVADSLEIDTDVAEIDFRSALTEGADYEFNSDVGAINLWLPADSSFRLRASSDVGGVSVQFDVVGEESRSFVGKTVEGVVNGPTDTSVSAESNVGAVTIHKQ